MTEMELAIKWFEKNKRKAKELLFWRKKNPVVSEQLKTSISYCEIAIKAIKEKILMETFTDTCKSYIAVKEEDDWGEYHCGLADGKEELAIELLAVIHNDLMMEVT